MPASVLDFLSSGLLQFGWWEMLAYLLVVTQLTIFSVTLDGSAIEAMTTMMATTIISSIRVKPAAWRIVLSYRISTAR